MREGWTYKKLWEVLVFDKRFKGISKEKQKKVASFEHVSAEKLKEIKADTILYCKKHNINNFLIKSWFKD